MFRSTYFYLLWFLWSRYKATLTESLTLLDTMLAGACIAVLSVLSSAGARGLVAEQTVKLSVHYESLCPDSIRFVTKQLYPSWKHFGKDILKVDLNPFGKANVSCDSVSISV